MEIIRPQQPAEWEAYYDLRYRVLRAPWQQAKGSEILEDEDQAEHAMLLLDGVCVAVARLHAPQPTCAQVRCVAVDPAHQGKGLGKALMLYLERIAQEKGYQEIVLEARENALPFYLSLGYHIEKPSYLLFGAIQHFTMRKVFTAEQKEFD